MNMHVVWLEMVRPERFELPAFWFVARRSIQLSYGRSVYLKQLGRGCLRRAAFALLHTAYIFSIVPQHPWTFLIFTNVLRPPSQLQAEDPSSAPRTRADRAIAGRRTARAPGMDALQR
jgi:hypothetical protein